MSLKDTKTKEKKASHSTFPVLRDLLDKKHRDIQKDDRRLDSRVNSAPITAISTVPSILFEIPSSDTDSAPVGIGAHTPTSPTWLFTPEHGCWVSHRQTEDYFGNVSQTVPVDVSAGDDSGDEVHSPTTSTPPSRYNSLKVPVVTPSLASTSLESGISGNTVISPKFQITKTKEDGKLHRKAKRNPLASFLDMDE